MRWSKYSEADLEEERRLAYVGITRAKKELYISNSVTRMLYGRTQRNEPSRFLREIEPGIWKRPAARCWNSAAVWAAGAATTATRCPAVPPVIQGFGLGPRFVFLRQLRWQYRLWKPFRLPEP